MGNDPTAGLVALVVILLLALVMRWVFAPSRPRRAVRLPVDASESPDLGLLSVVDTGLTRQAALARRARLQEAGIRSSMSRRRDGRMDVLVFHGDVDAARVLLDT